MRCKKLFSAIAFLILSVSAFAVPSFVEHLSTSQVFGEPTGTTMRQPSNPREGELVDIWIRIGYSFYYTDVAIYYTTDGSTPTGSKGVPSNTTQVLRSSLSQINFVRNESTGGGQVDWWRGTMPAGTRLYQQDVKYKIGAWHSSGGLEVFANNYGCEDGVCDNPGNPAITFGYTNFLAWPGAGNGQPNPSQGYPPVKFWKEEAVVGNNFINVMLDQNGTVYDVYGPGPGAVYGVSTKNEGYVDGIDTFPPGLPLDNRGQMHANQVMAGIRVDGLTHWLSNPNGVSYSNVTQSYVTDTNVVNTNAVLTYGGNNISVSQWDFSPYNLSSWPLNQGSNAEKGIYVKRMVLTNQGTTTKELSIYVYADWAINGGDSYDQMFADNSRGAMVAYDNTDRFTSASGEYNPTTTGDYRKNVSAYYATALKTLDSVGGATGAWATDTWRTSSNDNDKGWIGTKLTLAPGQSKEINICIAGGFDPFPNATGTYNYQIAPVLDWFKTTSMSSIQTQTQNNWIAWLNEGTLSDFPDDSYDQLFRRGLLGTALHLDGKNGGLIAGMHNGAYPFVWPRDAVYGAVSLTKTGHINEAREIYRFLRDIAYRGQESWGKGFFYQKYTTDGYIVWSAPQVDETACVPWGVWYLYQASGNSSDLTTNYQMCMDAGRAMSENSALDGRLYFDSANNLMHSMNVWEDSFDDFLYSNANVWRGLTDAIQIANAAQGQGYQTYANLFTSRAGNIFSGIRGRLAWNGENTDISQLGLTYPFGVLPANDSDMVRILDRMKGTQTDRFGNFKPIVRTSGEWTGLIDRYFGDNYWNGGPWFLSTLWYGLFQMELADVSAGKSAIDDHLYRLGELKNRLGPVGFGAEQISPTNSLLYPGQGDFQLQAAWPNAWESMSTFVDALMAFLDQTPTGTGNTIKVAPKLPTAWKTMSFKNVKQGTGAWDIRVDETLRWSQVTFVQKSTASGNFDCTIRVPAGYRPIRATVNGVPVTSLNYHSPTNTVRIQGALKPGLQAATGVRVEYSTGRVSGEPTIRP